MAISTYTELKAALVAWGKRSDLTAVIPDFIMLAEARIGRSFAPRGTETETELVTVVNSRYVALPSGMDSPLGLWMKDFSPRRELTQVLPTTINVSDVSGNPDYWCIDGDNIAFDKPASSAWDFDFRYQAPFALSVANPKNYVLTNFPDLYLWASMIEWHMYAQDIANAQTYEGRYQDALRSAQTSENDSRSVVLMTDLAGNSRSNIFEG